MSAVLRKKISAAGGLPPRLVQCAPLWDVLAGAVRRWSSKVYSGDLDATITSRRIVSAQDAQKRFAERFSFSPLTMPAGALIAVSIDRPGATRYAASRLHQPGSSLEDASDLFLRLMNEQTAHSLWANVQHAIGASEEAALGDPAALPDIIGPSARLAQVSILLAAEGGEDGWLLEGGEEVPEIRLYFDLAKLEKVADRVRARVLADGDAKEQPDRAALRSRLRQSSIRLEAVLDTVPMSVGECSRLNVGDVMALPGIEAGRLTLCAETMNGRAAIGEGEMGNWKGHRALKLNGPVIESFIREIAEI